MARLINRLSVRKMPVEPGLHADGRGLYLNVTKSGSRSWLFFYNSNKKRREMGLGAFPTVSLADARARVEELRQQIQKGIDPLGGSLAGPPFSEVALDLIESLRPGWKNAKHSQQWTNTLQTHAASLWSKPVGDIDTAAVMEVLSPIWSTIPETASRVRSRIERVLDAAKVQGHRSGDNPARWRGHLEVLRCCQIGVAGGAEHC